MRKIDSSATIATAADVVSAKTSSPTITNAVAPKRSRAMSAVPRRSNRLRSRPTAKKPKTIETTLNAPNQHDGLEIADRRKADVAEEVRLLEPVEGLRARAADERDADQQQQKGLRAHVPPARDRRPAQLAERGRVDAACPAHEAGLRHQQRAGEPARRS